MARMDELKKEWKQQLSKHTKGDLVDKLMFAYVTIMDLQAKNQRLEDQLDDTPKKE